jgi:hypothetical protein
MVQDEGKFVKKGYPRLGADIRIIRRKTLSGCCAKTLNLRIRAGAQEPTG